MSARLAVLLAMAIALLPGASALEGQQAGTPAPAAAQRTPDDVYQRADRELAKLSAQHLMLADDRRLFLDAARTAWQYGQRQYRSSGIIAPVPQYDYATVWDLGSSLAALYCARELQLLEQADYEGRMRKALATLHGLALFDDAAFNKTYHVSGTMVDRAERHGSSGFGWSATDIGRLLIWLRIIAVRHPIFAADAERIVRRLKLDRIVRDGYLWGEDIAPGGARRTYPEGQIGYEQYAAQGFALWGAKPDKALRLSENLIPIQVMGRVVGADERQRDRLTSEPFVLLGLEVGWTPEIRQLAREVLGAQAERARRTGIVTIVSEDAINQAPHFFFYYCVFANGRQFSIDVQDARQMVDGPRWVSTKAAFGWHALLPTSYTLQAVKKVAHARGVDGWSSGVYENTTQSTGSANINTAAVIMTAALYALRGEPMLTPLERGGQE
jgi:hypothetical protein